MPGTPTHTVNIKTEKVKGQGNIWEKVVQAQKKSKKNTLNEKQNKSDLLANTKKKKKKSVSTTCKGINNNNNNQQLLCSMLPVARLPLLCQVVQVGC